MNNGHLEELQIGSDRLQPYKTNDYGKVLYISVPFGDFRNECEFCEQFSPSFTDGGVCKKNGFSCGYGFTCEDYQYRFRQDIWILTLERDLNKVYSNSIEPEFVTKIHFTHEPTKEEILCAMSVNGLNKYDIATVEKGLMLDMEDD